MSASLAEVEAELERYGQIARVAMEEFLVRGRPDSYLYDLVRDYPQRPGKGLRPALLLATCEAFGGTVREGLGAAVALEMMHNAFLIHDDIQDASTQRRGGPTLHVRHGAALAINAGDALATLALQPLRDDGSVRADVARRLVDEFQSMVRVTTEGQALELGWRRHNVLHVGPDDYVALVGKKTCCYTTVAPLRMGALVGSRGAAALTPLARFGYLLGVAFQIRDDLLNLGGPDGRYGKERLEDIREGKRTLMLIHLLAQAAPAERAWLDAFLATPQHAREPDDCARVVALMHRRGSVAFASRYAAGIGTAAEAAFAEAFAPVDDSPARDFVGGLVPYMLSRAA
jgi:geranylgeranyl diphosphate synthase, type II